MSSSGIHNDAVTLGANTILVSTGTGNIAFTSSVDGARSLTVNTSGVTLFDVKPA